MITTAREIVCEQGSPEWLAIRAGFISPSRFKVLLYGKAKGQSTYLRELRSGKVGGFAGSVRALEWGKYHEPEARSMYELITGNEVKTTGFFVHNKFSRVGGSPDALVTDLNDPSIVTLGGLEIKCPYTPDVHERTLKFGVPREHLPQIQGYIWLLGRQWWDFVSYNPRHPIVSHRFFMQRVLRDELIQKDIDAKISWFHKLLVDGGEIEEESVSAMLAHGSVPRLF